MNSKKHVSVQLRLSTPHATQKGYFLLFTISVKLENMILGKRRAFLGVDASNPCHRIE